MSVRIKLDENLPSELSDLLQGIGHDVHGVADEGLTGWPDADVWKASQTESRFLITQDLDFSDSRRYEPGTHAGVMLVRLHDPSRRRLLTRVEEVFRAYDAGDWAACLVVVADHKIRIRRPR